MQHVEVRSSQHIAEPRQKVLVEVFGPKPIAHTASLTTETRRGTVQGCGGHYQCRVVPVTLPYSGTMQSVA